MRVASDIVVYAGAEMLSKGLVYLLVLIAAAMLPSEEYGVFSLVLGVQLLLATVLPMGQGPVLFQMYFQYEAEGRLKALQQAVLRLWLATSIVVVAVSLAFTQAGHVRLLPGVSLFPVLFLVLWAAYLDGFLGIVKEMYRAAGRALQSATVRTLPAALTLLFTVALFLVSGRDTRSYALAVFVSMAAAFAWVFPSFLRRLRSLPETSAPPPLAACFWLGLPLTLVVITGWVTNYGNRYILGYYSSLTAVGVYSLAFVLAQPMIFAAGVLNQAWLPHLFRTAASGESSRDTFDRQFVKYRAVVIWSLSFLGLVLALATRFAAPLIGSGKYPGVTSVSAVVLAGLVACSMYYVSVPLLYLHQKNQVVLVNNVAVAALNVGLNLVLVPRWQAFGSAVAYAASNVLLVLLTTGYAARLQKLPRSPGMWVATALAAGGILVISGVAGSAIAFVWFGVIAAALTWLTGLHAYARPAVLRGLLRAAGARSAHA